MKKLSILTGLACLTSFNSFAAAKPIQVHSTSVCSVDGKSIGKRYKVNYKGKKYVACCKQCAEELINRLG